MIRNYYNGLTKEEIGEVLLQTGVYCGIAAAEDSFRIAQEAFREPGVAGNCAIYLEKKLFTAKDAKDAKENKVQALSSRSPIWCAAHVRANRHALILHASELSALLGAITASQAIY